MLVAGDIENTVRGQKLSKFKFKMAASGHLEFSNNRNNFWTVRARKSKFCTMVAGDMRSITSVSKLSKFKSKMAAASIVTKRLEIQPWLLLATNRNSCVTDRTSP